MSQQPDALVLTINSGSSSIKVSLYRMGGDETLIVSGQLERIGHEDGRFAMKDAGGRALVEQALPLPDHAAALSALFDWLKTQDAGGDVGAVGHRVVHGGPRYYSPQRVTPEMLDEVRRLVPFDPLHLPSEIQGIEAVGRVFPDVPQVACFDTAFHRTLPDVGKCFALPRRFAGQGMHRYGFHGLSYEYIMEELAREAGARAANGRVVIAHLGNGASMAACLGGRSVDTTMGLTPLGGLVMGTRSGDLDPGVLLYLMTVERLGADDLLRLLNRESGLLGLSGVSADMRELLQHEADPNAALAVAVFCYQARKFLGALAASLGGLDTLVFTAGIGERSPAVRQRICEGLGFLGVELDGARNAASEAVISSGGSVTVRVMRTNEELMIARHTHRVLARGGPSA
jgi:acetate kinase